MTITEILIIIVVTVLSIYFISKLQMRAWLEVIERYLQQKQKNHDKEKKKE